MSSLAFSASLEYICYGSVAIINILFLTVWGSILDVRIEPRAVRLSHSGNFTKNTVLLAVYTIYKGIYVTVLVKK